MDYNTYQENFRQLAIDAGYSENNIQKCLAYAKPLVDRKLPVIYNSSNLGALVGYKRSYIKRASIFTSYFYREFSIKKKNGDFRVINEPLPSLKEIQHWILNNILYNFECSRFAKAYILKKTLLDNLRFHKNKELVLCIDIKDFFGSIKYATVFDIYQSMGYSQRVSTTLTNLCCLNGCLPQGAPTSAYLSNIFMYDFDEIVAKFSIKNNIRYTRYADDITLSGNFEVEKVLNFIKSSLPAGLVLNEDKSRIMRKGSRQLVTGVIVNDKLQVPKLKRKELRQNIYYIEKYGLMNHLAFIKCTKANYLRHLLGLVNYVLFINPNDTEAQQQKKYLKDLIRNQKPSNIYLKKLDE
jgi:RNA-directed DNA polymerase